jgi:hypothetical protein
MVPRLRRFSVPALYFKLIESADGTKDHHCRGHRPFQPVLYPGPRRHFIHAALPFAGGISIRPDLHVSVFGGDGDVSPWRKSFQPYRAQNIKLTYSS